MANRKHLEWLNEGVAAWNARRKAKPFTPDLTGAVLTKAVLSGARLSGAVLSGADLSGARLSGAVLSGADLWEADLSGADLREADLSGADLSGARLSGADLSGADLREADLSGADVRSYDFRDMWIVYSGVGTNDGSTPEYTTNLSKLRNLIQDQLDTMRGDAWTRIPDHLERPAHWLKEPGDDDALQDPPDPATDAAPTLDHDMPVVPDRSAPVLRTKFVDDRLIPDPAEPPDGAGLQTLFEEVRAELDSLSAQGHIGNVAPRFSDALQRYASAMTDTLAALDQHRLGLRGEALRLKFASERDSLTKEAPDKIGYIEALLFQHGLLAARLPDWQAFLKDPETQEPLTQDQIEAAEAGVGRFVEALEDNPETVDGRIPARLRSFLEAMRDDLDLMKIGAHMAVDSVADVVTGILQGVRGEIRDYVKGTYDTAKKYVIKGAGLVLASTLLVSGVTELSAAFPQTFATVEPAMSYVRSLEFLKK